MGLGKTIQVLAFLYSLYEQYDINGPHLIIMPLSVLTSWINDVNKFYPNNDTFHVYVHHNEKYSRIDNFKKWKYNLNSNKKKKSIMIVLTTYDLVIKDSNLFRSVNNWEYLIVSYLLFNIVRSVNASLSLLEIYLLTYDCNRLMKRID